jgi:hypothetical protein
MPATGRLVPNENQRRKHVFRATVVAHVFHTMGRWWWKKTFPSIKVRIESEDYARLCQVLRDECTDENGHYPTPQNQEVEIGFTEGERDQFAVGEDVEILFSTAGMLLQFFMGVEPFRWDGLRKKQQATL